MAEGIPIKDTQHLSSINGNEKLPISDGSGEPKHVTISDIKDYVSNNSNSATKDDITSLQNTIQSQSGTISSMQSTINSLILRISALENGTPSTPEEPEPDEPTNPDSIVGSVGSGNAIAINNDLGSVELYYLDANDNKLNNYDKIGEL